MALRQNGEMADVVSEEKNLSDSENEVDFEGSVLGTKEFWEDNFQRDYHVYQENYDIGDIWFGKESVDRVIKWLKKNQIPENASIIDIGCGNGATLIALAKEGYTNLYGVDYAESAIELATCIAEDNKINIVFEVHDFLKPLDEQDATREKRPENSKSCLGGQFDVCLDKGTYDAICLNPVNRAQQMALYANNAAKICRDGRGLFIITSCNWTREELVKQFSPVFTFVDQIPTPVFQFGGKEGSKETVCIFKKRTDVTTAGREEEKVEQTENSDQ